MVSICLIINKITFNQILGKWFWDIYDPNDVNNSTGSIISLWGSHEIQMQLDVCKISKKNDNHGRPYKSLLCYKHNQSRR